MAFNVREIYKALFHAEIDYAVIGGFAVILHGYLRATADLDLVMGLSDANCRRGLSVLSSIGFQPRLPITIEEFCVSENRRKWIEESSMLVFPLWDPKNPLRSLDLFVEEPIELSQLMRDASVKDVDGIKIRVASIEHLIPMKLIGGRPKDRDDIAKLKMIREEGAGYA